MELNIMEIGLIICQTDMECSNGRMDNITKDNFIKVKNMVKESMYGKTIVIIKEIGI